MELVIMGIVTALNFILIYHKFSIKRVADGSIDLLAFIVICIIFSTAGQAGLFVGMVASFIVSIYLYFNPPKFNLRRPNATT